jgi:hypothetical protein
MNGFPAFVSHLLMMWLFTLLLGTSTVHAAPFLRPDACEFGLGVAAGGTRAGVDWDLTTPGDFAFTASPVFSQSCTFATPRVLGWVGLDVVPTFQHSYRALRLRAPLVTQGMLGFRLRLGSPTTFGPHVLTNGLAFGGGLRLDVDVLSFRLNLIAGADPTAQLQAVYTFGARHSESPLSSYRDHPLRPGRLRLYGRTQAQLGFEIGTLQGLLVEIGHLHFRPHAYVRVGMLTSPFSGIALQPTLLIGATDKLMDPKAALFGLTWYNAWALAGGVTLRDGGPVPIASINHVLAPQRRSPVQFRYGVIVGPGQVAADVGWSWLP